jgi:hypothetical protein
MYIINKIQNRIEKIESTTFKQLGFKERGHLQEWIAHNPNCLNEELLIIQKEFNGFNDTMERLDLLALDKQGSIVVIENKLDDTGRDVTWQVLKYASYCATLNASQIITIFSQYLSKIGSTTNAEEVLGEFLETEGFRERLNNGNSQRIMMIAGEFRKEVTSTVLWLLNNGLRIQCFKATPYKLQEQLILNMEQIIPIKEAEDFVISMANKNREEVGAQEENRGRFAIRLKFWAEFIKEINKVSSIYLNVSPSKDSWIGGGTGVSGISFNSVATRDYVRIELYINAGDKESNKKLFDAIYQSKSQIESQMSMPLVWERLDEKITARVKCELTGVSIFNEEDWKKMIAFMVKVVPQFETAFRKPIQELNKKYVLS